MTLILASASPRRRELLQRVGVVFEVQPAEIEEQQLNGELPGGLVSRLAQEKATAVAQTMPDSFVLAADTVVVLPEAESSCDLPAFDQLKGRVLGKPRDEQDAQEMLRMLSGQAHYVITGFSLSCLSSNISEGGVSLTQVCFGKLSHAAVKAYAASGEGADKAGAYAVQGVGACLVSKIRGSYTNVVGLPLKEVLDLLERHCLWSPNALVDRAG